MQAGRSVSVFYFDVMADATTIRLAAAIVWRHGPHTRRSGGRHWERGLAGWLRRLRLRFWLRFGPLGLDMKWRGARPRGSGVGTVRSVGLIGDAVPRAYYDGRTVRLLGRLYTVPAEERALVLLVDESGGRAGGDERPAAPRVAVRTIRAPLAAAPAPPLGKLSSDDAALRTGELDVRTDAVAGGGGAEWERALRANPEVRDFMDADLASD